MEKTFKLVTLGCRTNQYETQAYRDQLLSLGYTEVEGEASLCIVNTCTVTASADSSSRHQIRRIIRENPHAKVAVTGCMVDNDPHLNKEIEGIYQITKNKEKEKLLSYLLPEENFPEFSIQQFQGHTRAFVKVQDGCNSFCSYCIIPYVRGRSRSRKIHEVVQEVEGIVASGYQEIVLGGINVGDFEKGLSSLIRAIDKIDGLQRLRLSSIDPDEVDDDLLDAILYGRTTCHSLHIVLQSGSNAILTRMRRKYTKQCFLETIERLKQKSCDFTFTTDIIVGFPGESESDFEETLEVIREVKFAKVHMFPYSRRERTKAALFPDQVPHDVIVARKQRVLREAEKMAFAVREKYVGRKMTILTEECEGDTIVGHTHNFLKVALPKRDYKPNQWVEVMLVENTPQGLVGR